MADSNNFIERINKKYRDVEVQQKLKMILLWLIDNPINKSHGLHHLGQDSTGSERYRIYHADGAIVELTYLEGKVSLVRSESLGFKNIDIEYLIHKISEEACLNIDLFTMI